MSNAVQVEEFDVVVIGTGEGSKYLAWTMARQGKRVASVERKWIGGACPNMACLPSKNVIHSAKVAQHVQRAAEFGVTANGYAVDMVAVRERKRAMVRGLVDMHLKNFESSGAELVMGSAKFIGPRTIEVSLNDGGIRVLRGANVVIGTGTHATVDATPGLAEARPLTHIEMLELDALPEHLVVVGGGHIGLEFAQAMRRFGSRVTVIERNTRMASREDMDVSEELARLFEDEGIEVLLRAQAVRVSGISGSAVDVTVLQDGVERSVRGTHLLVATGRTPNTKGIGLDVAGVDVDARGYLKVNDRLQTTAEGVWGCGEVAGSPQFTHVAFDDFRVIRDNMNGKDRVTTGRLVPYCLFTDPELAHVGLSEAEAKVQGVGYRLFKIPMMSDLRTRTLSETRGFMKALVAADNDRILGFTAFGVEAGEIMAAMQMAMIGDLPYTAVREAGLTHPTLAEGLIALLSSAPTVHGDVQVGV